MLKKRPSASDTKDSRGREFCVRHSDGRVSDATLHEQILDNPEAEAATREIGKAVARRASLTAAEIKKLYD
jgi:hypothetical protein